MSYQECALYGDLVRYLRDHCAERLAQLDAVSDAEASRTWLDDLIRDWFFTPQHDLRPTQPTVWLSTPRKYCPSSSDCSR